ncbi:MBL fold metallo-hydrolase [Thalassobaculum sp.]|uniref:MBL fold metallo-hydrolase n=1 Tax=Thalassobaculum sp. TaxID=2022740 RepID=UPI0032EAECE0
MAVSLGFFGGAGTVTGSKYLLEAPGRRVLVDCGLFQGSKPLRRHNWEPMPFDPRSVDAVVLTHAHLDHSGYLPRLVRDGFNGPVHATPATRDLCEILLRDNGRLQERDAELANRHGFSRHRPALPFYTEADAAVALRRFAPVPFDAPFDVGGGLTLRFRPSGHILGAALAALSWELRSVLFSGDLGRWNSTIMPDPARVEETDYLLVESVYGDRRHAAEDPEELLAEVISRTAARGGTVLIPALAVGWAQTLLFHLHRLKARRRIPDLPVFVDSPMALNAAEIFCRYLAEHRLTAAECRAACNVATYVQDAGESAALDRDPAPKVIVSASGRATGGRILDHLAHFASDPRNAIVFGGLQAEGTRGAAIAGGAEAVRIYGRMVQIRAEVANLHLLSAHADADDIMAWLSGFRRPPRRTFVVQGEPPASEALRRRIVDELGWDCEVPEHGRIVTLD